MDTQLDFGTLIALASVVSAFLGMAGTLFYERRKNRRAQQAQDDENSERLIGLIQREADKRVEIVRADFKVQLLEQSAKHAEELNAMRRDFEEQLATRDKRIEELASTVDAYGCDDAPACKIRKPRRHAAIKVGGTD